MGVKLLESRLCLLLLLGLVMVVASFQISRNLTPSEKFVVRHINMTNPRCTIAMKAVNKLKECCKDKNTFLHTSFAAVVGVCGSMNTTCHNGRTNCHNSSAPVNLTLCDLTKRTKNYTDCEYQEKPGKKFYRIACDHRTPQDDPTYPIVPVHLDGTF